MKKINLKSIIVGLLLGIIITSASNVFAVTLTKQISIYDNVAKILFNGNNVTAKTFTYNNKVYILADDIAKIFNKSILINKTITTVNFIDKKSNVLSPTSTKPTIIQEGFKNSGTLTFYYVEFSDGFSVFMDINKQNNTLFGATNEAILLNVQYEKVDLPSYINIIGFSDIMKENYYPIDFSQYNKNIPKAVLTDVKKMDFFETFKTTTDKNFNGYIVYDSFVTLEGVKFDDGIHQCTLYISDNDR